MSFWDKIQADLKQNLQEGIEVFKVGSSVFTEKIEELKGEGKKKYRVFNLNMKVQDEFAKLGGTIYDLTIKKAKNPLSDPKVKSIMVKINKLEDQISDLDAREDEKPVKKAVKKRTVKKKAATKRKTATKKKAVSKKKTTTKKKAAVKTNKA